MITMRRGALATIFIFHALLHASIGVWAVADHSILVANTLWSVAVAAYLATGLAILRMPVLRRYWRTLLFAATFASVVLLTLCGSLLALLGIPVDLFLVRRRERSIPHTKVDHQLARDLALGAKASYQRIEALA